MPTEGKQQELERANLEEMVIKIEADTVPAAESCSTPAHKPLTHTHTYTAVGPLYSRPAPCPCPLCMPSLWLTWRLRLQLQLQL